MWIMELKQGVTKILPELNVFVVVTSTDAAPPNGASLALIARAFFNEWENSAEGCPSPARRIVTRMGRDAHPASLRDLQLAFNPAPRLPRADRPRPRVEDQSAERNRRCGARNPSLRRCCAGSRPSCRNSRKARSSRATRIPTCTSSAGRWHGRVSGRGRERTGPRTP